MSSERPSSQSQSLDEVFNAHRTDRREDVADQPGWSRSFFGLVGAIFCGLLIQGAFSEEMITNHVRRAATKIHDKVFVEFDHANFSLADGPFPEFAIVVEGVRLASSETCWLSPLVEVDELRLPVDFWSLLQGKVEIQEVKLGQVNLQLRTPPEACSKSVLNGASSVPPSALTTSEQDSAPPSSSLTFPPRSRGPITRVSVYNLQIHYLPLPFTSLDISRLQIDRLGEDPLALTASGDVNLGGATLSGDYSSRARVQIDYRHPEVVAEVAGTWREGTYRLRLESDIETKMVGAEGRIDHLPLSQILPVLTKYRVIKGEYDGRQVWLNLKFRTPEKRIWKNGLPLHIETLGFEGDLGQIEGGDFEISKWDPIEFSNTAILLRGLQVEKLLRLFGQTEKYQSLGALGELNGLLKIQGDRRFELNGEYSGLELVFSNGRERQTQTITLMTGVIKADHDRWSLHVDRIRAAEGLVIGQLFMDGDLAKQQLHAKLQIDEMNLAPNIQSMMTNGGSLGRWAFDLEGEWEKSSLQSLHGQVLTHDLLVEGVGVSRLRTSVLSGRDRVLRLDLKGMGFTVQEGSRLRTILSPLASSVGQDFQGQWSADQLQLDLDFFPNERLKWKLRPLNFHSWQLRSDGGWNLSGQLNAQVLVRGRDRESRWKIEGFRDSPVFIEER